MGASGNVRGGMACGDISTDWESWTWWDVGSGQLVDTREANHVNTPQSCNPRWSKDVTALAVLLRAPMVLNTGWTASDRTWSTTVHYKCLSHSSARFDAQAQPLVLRVRCLDHQQQIGLALPSLRTCLV